MLKVLSIFLLAISLNIELFNAQTTTAPNCGSGFYKVGTVCTICPAGYYCNGLVKSACPIGTSTNNQTGAGQCTECMQDTYASVTGSKFCLACPAGSYCPNKTIAIPCGKGTAGKINQNDYRWNASQCVACPLGTYASVTGSAYCNLCPNGSYCADPTIPPVTCPKGTSSSIDISNSYSNQYYYSPEAQGYSWLNGWQAPPTYYINGYQFVIGSMCIPCPVGTYADVTGLTYCKKCPAGSYCADKTAAPVKCPKGYFSNNTTFTQYISINSNNYNTFMVGDSCTKCNIGNYTSTTGATECTPCPDGKYCPDPSLDPLPIPAGYYVQSNSYWDGNNNVNYPTLYRCWSGMYSINATNGTNSTYNNYYGNNYNSPYENCAYCPPGYFCPDATKAPIPCPKGYYSYGSASSCMPCQSGSYASQPGSTQCNPCPSGAQCSDPTVEPQLCPPGSYQPSSGQVQCYPCSPGWSYSSQPGATTCNSCPWNCCCRDPTQEPVCPGGGSTTPNWYNWQTTPDWGQQNSSNWNNYGSTSAPPPPPYGTSSPFWGRK